jgi:hypothetical protein
MIKNFSFGVGISPLHGDVGDGAEKRDPLLQSWLQPLRLQQTIKDATIKANTDGVLGQRTNM